MDKKPDETIEEKMELLQELEAQTPAPAETPVVLIAEPFQVSDAMWVADERTEEEESEEAASEALPEAGPWMQTGAASADAQLSAEMPSLEAAAADFKPDAEYIAAAAPDQKDDLAPQATQEELDTLSRLSAAMAAEDQKQETIAQPEQEVAQDPAEAQNTPVFEAEQTAAPDEEESEPVALDVIDAQASIEAVLFMADKPLSAERLQQILGEATSFSVIQDALTELHRRYQGPEHGFELVTVAGGYQFRTKASRAGLAKKMARVQTQKLSAGAMETLAIVAYKQPVMKEDVDRVRGVDSSYFIRGLLDRKLIRISGRSELPGRPMLYTTTPEFLELFGLRTVHDLPSLREIEQMVPTSQAGSEQDEDPKIREMRKLVGEMKADGSTSLLYNPKDDEKFLTDIRERVKSIPTTTPYLEEQARMAKEAEQAARDQAEALASAAASVLEGQVTVVENPEDKTS